jgi:hypothetical protein
MKKLHIADDRVMEVVRVIRAGLGSAGDFMDLIHEDTWNDLDAWCDRMELLQEEAPKIRAGVFPRIGDICKLGQVDPYVRRALDLYRDGVFPSWTACMMTLVLWLLQRKAEPEEKRELRLLNMVGSIVGMVIGPDASLKPPPSNFSTHL